MKRLGLFLLGIAIFVIAAAMNSLALWGKDNSDSLFWFIFGISINLSYLAGLVGLVAALLGKEKLTKYCFIALATPPVMAFMLGMGANLQRSGEHNKIEQQARQLLKYPILIPDTPELDSSVYIQSDKTASSEVAVRMNMSVPSPQQSHDATLNISQGLYQGMVARLLPQNDHCDINKAADYFFDFKSSEYVGAGQLCVEKGSIASNKLWYFDGEPKNYCCSGAYFIWNGTAVIAEWDRNELTDEQALGSLRKAFDQGHKASQTEIEQMLASSLF